MLDEQHEAATLDPVDAANHQGTGDDGADRGRRIEPAVAARADVQNVLSEDRQERRRRREERRKEVEQHRRADERRAKHEAQPFERRGDGEVAADAGAVLLRAAASAFGIRIISSAPMTNRNETALKAYTHATPPVAMTTPPSAGPATDATCAMIVFSVMAFGRCSRGTRLGTSDCRAGRSNAPAAELHAAST